MIFDVHPKKILRLSFFSHIIFDVHTKKILLYPMIFHDDPMIFPMKNGQNHHPLGLPNTFSMDFSQRFRTPVRPVTAAPRACNQATHFSVQPPAVDSTFRSIYPCNPTRNIPILWGSTLFLLVFYDVSNFGSLFPYLWISIISIISTNIYNTLTFLHNV